MMQNQEKKTVVDLIGAVQRDRAAVICSGLAGAADALLVSRMAASTGRPMVVVSPTTAEAERFFGDVCFFSSRQTGDPCMFPAYAMLPFKSMSYHSQIAADRISLLYRLSQKDMPPVIVTTLAGLVQKLIPRRVLCDFAEIVMNGEEIGLTVLTEKLIAGGYTRAAIVEEPGDFSVRGGILDVFSPFYPDPVRIELFGDLVESMRFFSPTTQRRLGDVEEAIILPARESVLVPEQSGRFIAAVKQQAAGLDLPLSVSREIINQIKNGDGPAGLGSLMPFFYEKLDTLFDYFPADACYVFLNEDDWPDTMTALWDEARGHFDDACQQGRLLAPPETRYLTQPALQDVLSERCSITLTILPQAGRAIVDQPDVDSVHLAVKDSAHIKTLLKSRPVDETEEEGALAGLAQWICDRKTDRQTIVITCESRSQSEQIASLLKPYAIEPVYREGWGGVTAGDAGVYIVSGRLSAGFEFAEENLVVICEKEILGRRRRARRPDKRSRDYFLALEDLKIGDLVVHVDHGIGRYDGVVKVTVEGVANDFLLIQYKDDDKLYLSVDRMDMIAKYVGVDEVVPVLDKMGGKSWDRVKQRARGEVEKIAKDLLALYAKRKVRDGHAFDIADDLLQKFEDGFPYEETEDQHKVIEDVLADLQSPVPMDRLVCGDVGYGKTEVGMRAAFVAACDGKQVAVMVPTTVLAEQHLTNFQERFAPFPINIACLNRFRTTAQQKEIVADLKAGKIDIVIGTHRLLSKDVGFRDLGLIILDEEQRFGVKQKESLKKMRSTVDVLSLTATPIPRTLHMSLTGVRDISIINTPPEQRRAVKTYIAEFDDGIVKAAVRKELARGGQVYFVHNNIHKIGFIANRLQKLVPEARLGVAHGRLSKDALETEMLQFINKEIDMLVCTRIIEAGLDIPSVNTIFVNRADLFGLAQIYQLRGRVGRSDQQAYAYLFIPRDSALSKDAQKRLKVLMEHNDLGSGFQIAMNDLQIRGGGSALGVSQSGHIAAVGYDMFLQLMENSIAELKGEPVEEKLEPEINLPMSAFIDETYIPDMDQRLTIYRRLSKTRELPEISAIREEMIDRYGKMPTEAETLLLKIMLKIMAIKSGARRLDITDTHLVISFSPAHLKQPEVIVEMVTADPGLYSLTPQHVLKVRLDGKTGRSAVQFAKNVLKAVYQRVNN